MTDKARGDSGAYTREVSDAELLAAVRTHNPAATSEVAGEVDMTRQGVDRRLRQLRDDGRVNSKKIGASLVWFPVADETGTDADTAGESRRDTGASGAESAADDSTGVSVGDDVPERIDDADARAAVSAAVTFVRDNAPVEKREITDAVRPAHPLGYGSGDGEGRDRSAWWRRVVRPGLRASGVEYVNGVGWRVDDAHPEGEP